MSLPRSWVDLQPDMIRVSHPSPQYDLGQRGLLPDGRAFRYVKAGAAALEPSRLYQYTAAATVTNHAGLAVPAAVPVGATSITLTNGANAITQNQFAGGWAIVEESAGAGYMYQIDSHPAAGATDPVAIKLYNGETVKVALTTGSKVSLLVGTNDGVIIHPSPATQVLAGVPVHAVAAGQYGWVQTRGVAAVLQQGALVVGRSVTPSASVDGAVAALIAADTAAVGELVGYAIRNAGNGNVGTVNLCLD